MESYFKTGFLILSMNFAVDYDESLTNQFQLRKAEILWGGQEKQKLVFASINRKNIFFIDLII